MGPFDPCAHFGKRRRRVAFLVLIKIIAFDECLNLLHRYVDLQRCDAAESNVPPPSPSCRFFQCLQTLVGCGLSGPTSPLAFGEAVLGAIRRSAASVQKKEHLWRAWSAVVTPLTDTITQVGAEIRIFSAP